MPLAIKLPSFNSTLVTTESTYLAQNGKYQQYLKNVLAPNVAVHEYVGPQGPGYKVYQFEFFNNQWYMRSFGEGPETNKYFDWIPCVAPD